MIGRRKHRLQLGVELRRPDVPVVILGVPAGDPGVGHRDVERREHARSGRRRGAALEQPGARDLVPEQVCARAAIHLPEGRAMVRFRRARQTPSARRAPPWSARNRTRAAPAGAARRHSPAARAATCRPSARSGSGLSTCRDLRARFRSTWRPTRRPLRGRWPGPQRAGRSSGRPRRHPDGLRRHAGAPASPPRPWRRTAQRAPGTGSRAFRQQRRPRRHTPKPCDAQRPPWRRRAPRGKARDAVPPRAAPRNSPVFHRE